MQSVEKKCLSRIYGHGRGWVFSQKDFSDIGTRNSIDWSFNRLTKKNIIRRIIRGIYDYPEKSSFTNGFLSPDIYEVANAIARKQSWILEPSGETALNILGLSTQIPASYLFYTDGPDKQYLIGKQILKFRRKALRNLRFKHKKSILLNQAIQAIGQANLTDEIQHKLTEQVDCQECSKIVKDMRYAPEWVVATVRSICRNLKNE